MPWVQYCTVLNGARVHALRGTGLPGLCPQLDGTKLRLFSGPTELGQDCLSILLHLQPSNSAESVVSMLAPHNLFAFRDHHLLQLSLRTPRLVLYTCSRSVPLRVCGRHSERTQDSWGLQSPRRNCHLLL